MGCFLLVLASVFTVVSCACDTLQSTSCGDSSGCGEACRTFDVFRGTLTEGRCAERLVDGDFVGGIDVRNASRRAIFGASAADDFVTVACFSGVPETVFACASEQDVGVFAWVDGGKCLQHDAVFRKSAPAEATEATSIWIGSAADPRAENQRVVIEAFRCKAAGVRLSLSISKAPLCCVEACAGVVARPASAAAQTSGKEERIEIANYAVSRPALGGVLLLGTSLLLVGA
jgi:hypothetical protein